MQEWKKKEKEKRKNLCDCDENELKIETVWCFVYLEEWIGEEPKWGVWGCAAILLLPQMEGDYFTYSTKLTQSYPIVSHLSM